MDRYTWRFSKSSVPTRERDERGIARRQVDLADLSNPYSSTRNQAADICRKHTRAKREEQHAAKRVIRSVLWDVSRESRHGDSLITRTVKTNLPRRRGPNFFVFRPAFRVAGISRIFSRNYPRKRRKERPRTALRALRSARVFPAPGMLSWLFAYATAQLGTA